MKPSAQGHKVSWAFVVAGALFLLAFAMHLPLSTEYDRFFYLIVISSAVFVLFVVLLVTSLKFWGNKATLILVFAGIAYRLAVIGIEPVASDDVYRYIWDGKMQTMGIDPFQYAPIDTEVQEYHTDVLPGKINFPEMKTIYPPVAQWVFWLCYAVGGESIFVFKLPLLIAEILSIILLLLLLRETGFPLVLAALYAWCPLPIFQFMIDGHMDALMYPSILLFALLWIKSKRLQSVFWLGISIATKLVSALFIPLMAKEAFTERKYYLFIVPVFIVSLFYLPYMLLGGSPFESLGVYSMNWTFNGSIFPLIANITGDNQIARYITLPLLAVWVLYVSVKGESVGVRIYWAIFGFLALAPTAHPWYIGWLALVLPLHFRWTGLLLIVLSSLSNMVGTAFHAGEPWYEPQWLPYVQYFPVYILLVWEFIKYGLNKPLVPSENALNGSF